MKKLLLKFFRFVKKIIWGPDLFQDFSDLLNCYDSNWLVKEDKKDIFDLIIKDM